MLAVRFVTHLSESCPKLSAFNQYFFDCSLVFDWLGEMTLYWHLSSTKSKKNIVCFFKYYLLNLNENVTFKGHVRESRKFQCKFTTRSVVFFKDLLSMHLAYEKTCKIRLTVSCFVLFFCATLSRSSFMEMFCFKGWMWKVVFTSTKVGWRKSLHYHASLYVCM